MVSMKVIAVESNPKACTEMFKTSSRFSYYFFNNIVLMNNVTSKALSSLPARG
jgi:hypothetical protein